MKLSILVDYFVHSMLGVHNLPSTIFVFTLLQFSSNNIATSQDIQNLIFVLHYKMVQDVRSCEILNIMNIPRFAG